MAGACSGVDTERVHEDARRLEGIGRPTLSAGLLDDLAARVAWGEVGALSELFELLSEDLYNYALHLSGDAALADDIVAETFLAAWRSASTYRTGSGTYRAWLFRIARNQLRSTWARQRRERQAIEELAAGSETSERPPDGAMEWLRQSLGELTPDQREAVVLRYVAGLDIPDIARLLGRREGAVRSLLHRAIRRMRRFDDDAASHRPGGP